MKKKTKKRILLDKNNKPKKEVKEVKNASEQL